jgi:hypothetical protein
MMRNDGRGTPIATLLADAPDAIRGDGSATAVSIVIWPGPAIVWKNIQPKERT